MFQFVETMAYMGGKVPLLDYHQERVNCTFWEFFPGKKPHRLRSLLPKMETTETLKLRLQYGPSDYVLEACQHQQPVVSSLRVVSDDRITYPYKYADRTQLNRLLQKRRGADEVIIVKNGLVSDSSMSNLCFYDQKRWYTSTGFLLNGIRRQHLLATRQIREIPIDRKRIETFHSVCLINALLDLGDVTVPIEKVK